MGKKILILFITLFVVITTIYPADYAGAGHEKGHVVVRIDNGGFEGNPGAFNVDIEQGQLVEFTFVWAHQGYPNEEHIMVLSGYKLEWDKIDIRNRQATVKFIADKVGTFNFKCDLHCDLHDYLQNGRLRVRPAGSSAGAAARTPSKLALNPSEWTTRGQAILLTTKLTDEKGEPIAKAELKYYVDAEFIGRKGEMEIGVAKTDANGIAFLSYRPTIDVPKHKITAKFEGMGIYDESATSIEVEEIAPPPPAYSVAPLGLDDIRRAAPVVLVGLVVAIWALYTFVLSQIFGIFRLRERR